MAKAIVTLKIMPEDPEQDLDHITTEAEKKVRHFAGDTEHKVSREPIAFGLVAVKIIFVMDEKLGGTDNLETEIKKIKGVQGCETIDVRRAIG